jgi:hypothetical protein
MNLMVSSPINRIKILMVFANQIPLALERLNLVRTSWDK